MPFPLFDRSRLRIRPLAERQHDLDLSILLPLDAPSTFSHPALPVLAQRLVEAKRQGRARMLIMGAHVLRAGVARYLIDLMERGLIDHIAMNGAGPIHDWEFALIGASTETFCRWVKLMLLFTTTLVVFLILMFLTASTCCTSVRGGRGTCPLWRPL